MLDLMFLITAIGGGTIMLVQVALTLLGLDDGDGHGDIGGHHLDAGDAEMDVAGASEHGDVGSHLFEVLSFRSLVGAATFFGLAGKAARTAGMSEFASVGLATLAGVAALYGVYWIMRQIYRLQTSGNEDIRNALGKRAQVIVAIPAAHSGAGKVHVKMQNRLIEYRAISGDADTLRSGTEVAVLDCIGGDTLEVTKVALEPAATSSIGVSEPV